MNIDEMKDRISMALKDPILQQGFEIICKENADLEIYNEELLDDDIEKYSKIVALEKENAELKEEWKKCFLSCSSPFCSKHFPTVESSGVLGNMEKKENLKRGTK